MSSWAHTGKIPLLIDCDADLDDFIGILYLIHSERADIKMISVTPVGKSHYEYGAKNILKLLHFAHAPSISVATTRQPSLSHVGEYPYALKRKIDEFFNNFLPEAPLGLYAKSSSDALVESLLNSPEKMHVFCTGPLTNLAIAFMMKPEILSKIERVYILGGAINVQGNLLEKINGQLNHQAEYNIYLDAKAADLVFRSGVPITLIPLDVLANLKTISSEIYRYLAKTKRTLVEDFIFRSCEPFRYPQNVEEANFWGALGAVLILNPGIAECMQLKLKIHQEWGPLYGATALDFEHGSLVNVYTKTDCMKFFQYFMSVISKIQED